GTGERLAAGAGTEIQHLHPGFCTGEFGNDLRAFVLHLEPALLKGWAVLYIGMPAVGGNRRNTDAMRGEASRCRLMTGERFKHSFTPGPERIDPKVQRRTRAKLGAFLHPAVTKG